MTFTSTLSKAEIDQAIVEYMEKKGFTVESKITYLCDDSIRAVFEVITNEQAARDSEYDYYASIGR